MIIKAVVDADPTQYPSSDGKRMAENMTQARWIALLYGNLCALLAHVMDAFVAADNLWYPVMGDRSICYAPDVYVVFGRPKGDRPCYVTSRENDVPITVVFEILSPSNKEEEMADKFAFYEQYGVEEYYVYDPDRNYLEIYNRGKMGAALVRIRDIKNYRSPRLGIRFEMTSPEMTVYGPDGKKFRTTEEREADEQKALRERDEQVRANQEQRRLTEAERLRADEARQLADEARQLADAERVRAAEANRLADAERVRADEAKRQADEERLQAADARQRADEEQKLRRRVVALSRKVRLGQATAEEIAELERLEADSA